MVDLSLSVVGLSVKLTPAVDTSKTTSGFKTVCVGHQGEAHPPLPIRAPWVCDAGCGEIEDRKELSKGFVQGDGSVVLADADMLAEAKAAEARTKGVVELLPYPADKVRAMTAPAGKVYYVTPEGKALDRYRLLAATIKSTPDLAYLAQYTPSSRSGLYQADVLDNGLVVLIELRRPDALKPQPLLEGGTVNEKHLAHLQMFLEAEEFDFDTFTSDYAAAVSDMRESREAVAMATASTSDDLLGDQLAALAKSIKPTKKRKKAAA